MDCPSKEGPNRIIPTSNLTTTCPDGAVKLRLMESDDVPESIPGLLERIAALHPDKPALGYKKNPDSKEFDFITYREYLNLVRTVAKAFIKLGLERYHSVAIIGFNSPEWFISYLAAIHAGGIASGLYMSNSPETCFYCLKNSRANIVVAGDQTLVEKITKYQKDLSHLKKIIQYEGTPTAKDVLSWTDLLNMGEEQPDKALGNVLKKVAINQCASIVYTSGTVGNPKSAMISHDNLIFAGKVGINVLELKQDEIFISYLPISFMPDQIVDMIGPIILAGTVYFANKDAPKGGLLKNLLEVRPTCFWGDPKVWVGMYERMREIDAQAGLITRTIATWAKNQGLRRHMDLMNGLDSPSFGYLLARKFIFSKLKQNLGLDRCTKFFSGAAPLSTDIKKYFASLDILVGDAYGMTECSGGQTINLPTAFRFEGVGRTFPGIKTKINAPGQDNTGEICIYGRHVFMGYYNDRKSTDEAIDENGWLRSGDIGKIDENGFLHITGRKKDIIITNGGENISPVLIEENIKKELPCLGYAVIIGDGRNYLTVLLTLSCEVNAETGKASEKLTETSKKWLKDLGCHFTTIKDVIKSGPAENIMKAIQSGIDAANLSAMTNGQKVKKFALLPHDFSISTGEIGPTMKLRRNVVISKYKDIIDQLF